MPLQDTNFIPGQSVLFPVSKLLHILDPELHAYVFRPLEIPTWLFSGSVC